MTSSLTDAELVARCRAGDEAAWTELVERFSRYVFAIATQGFRLSEHDAEDVFQDVFARTYERLDALRDDAAIRPWLAQLTRNLCVDRLRDSARVEPAEDIEPREVDETLAQLDLAMTVRGALEDLGEPCSDLLDRFWRVGPELAELHVSPLAAEAPPAPGGPEPTFGLGEPPLGEGVWVMPGY